MVAIFAIQTACLVLFVWISKSPMVGQELSGHTLAQQVGHKKVQYKKCSVFTSDGEESVERKTI